MQLTFGSSIMKKLLGGAASVAEPLTSLDLGHADIGPLANPSDAFVDDLTDRVVDPRGTALRTAADLEAVLNAGGER
jgi:hypothetical protein